jgi:hypothetical protein
MAGWCQFAPQRLPFMKSIFNPGRLPDPEDSSFADLTNLTAVQFRAKGRGEWFIGILTDSVPNDTVANWSQMSLPFTQRG